MSEVSRGIIIIYLPEDWSKNSCGALFTRLTRVELPAGLEVQMGFWSADDGSWYDMQEVTT